MGYNLIKRVHALEEKANELGFLIGYPKFTNNDNLDRLGMYPCDDQLPIYARDTQLFGGTLDQAEEFLRGIEWARNYDRMIKLSTPEKRYRKEQDYRNSRLVSIIANSD